METEYFIVVEEFMTTFGQDPMGTEPLTLSHEFRKTDYHNSLNETHDAACEFYYERINGLEAGTFFLPFAGPEEFVRGEHAAFSLTMYLVIDEPAYYSPTFGWMPPSRTELPLMGEAPEELVEGNEILNELLMDEYI